MASRDERLRVLIEAQNLASAELHKLRDELKGVGDQTEQVTDRSKAAASASKEFGSALGQIKSMAVSVGLALGVRELISFTSNALQAAEAADRIAQGFQTLAGVNATAMFNQLKEAANGAITDADLMLAANRAMMLNVTNDADTMVKLLEVAAARGRAMGLSTAQAFDNIVTGIGRMSPLILDNLGILTGGEQAFKDYAASIGKTADQLTDLEKREMLIKKVLQGWTEDTEVATTATEAWQAAWDNLVAASGREIATGQIPGTQKSAAEAVQSYADYSNAIADGRNLVDQYSASLQKMADSGQITQRQFKYLNEELQGIRKNAGQVPIQELRDALDALMFDEQQSGTYIHFIFGDNNPGGWADAYAQQIAQAQTQTVEFQQALVQLESQMTPERYDELSQRIMNISEAYARGYISEAQFKARLEELDPALLKIVQDARELEAAIAAATSHHEAVVIEGDASAAESAMDNAAAQAEHLARQTYTFYLNAEMQVNGQSVTAGNSAFLADYINSAMAQASYSTISNPDFDAMLSGRMSAEQSNAAAEAQRNLNYYLADGAGKIRILRDEQAAYAEGSAEYINLDYEIAKVTADMASEADSYASSLKSLAEAQDNARRSMAEGLLSPTTVTELDQARTNLGKYKDQWDEYIRRLDSAATDPNSAWTNLIPQDVLDQGSDAIKVWVAEQKDLFYNGLIPDKINWEAFDRAAQQEAQQQAGRESMIQTAMDRLANLGITGMTESEAASMLGLPTDYTQLGQDNATQLATGLQTGLESSDLGSGAATALTGSITSAITDQDVAGSVSAAFEKAFGEQVERWQTMGFNAMSWFTAGLLNGANSGPAEALVSIIEARVFLAMTGKP